MLLIAEMPVQKSPEKPNEMPLHEIRHKTETPAGERLRELLNTRIVFLDGAMGTMIQRYKLAEADYRGDRFADTARTSRATTTSSCITRPESSRKSTPIPRGRRRHHRDQYLQRHRPSPRPITASRHRPRDQPRRRRSGAAPRRIHAANPADRASSPAPSARRARPSPSPAMSTTPAAAPSLSTRSGRSLPRAGRGHCWMAASISSCRNHFDTLNSRPPSSRSTEVFADRPGALPVIALRHHHRPSADAPSPARRSRPSGLPSRTPRSSASASIAPSARRDAPLHRGALPRRPVYVSCYPNAGLPNPSHATGFAETPESLAPQLPDWAEQGWLNIVGGCCGTTPAHIKAIADAVRDCPPRAVPTIAAAAHCASAASSPYASPRTPRQLHHGRRADQHHRLAANSRKLILAGDFEEPSPSPASRSRAAPTSSTSTWTRG